MFGLCRTGASRIPDRAELPEEFEEIFGSGVVSVHGQQGMVDGAKAIAPQVLDEEDSVATVSW